MIELRQFEVLRAIAQEGSLAGAARMLHCSQPTIAHHLGGLESHFQAPLVHRGSRGVRLTAVGELVLPQAEAVLGRIALLDREVRALVRRGVHTLRIGTFPTAGALLLPVALQPLVADGVEISLLEREVPILIDALTRRAVQIAILYSQPGEPLDLGEEFLVEALLDDPLYVAVPQNDPRARQPVIELGALREANWIMGTQERDPSDRLLTWACAQAGFEPVHTMRTDDYAVMKGLVAAGLGVALVPRLALTDQEIGIAIRPVTAAVPLARQISVVMLRSTVSKSAVTLRHSLRVQADRLLASWRDW